MKNNDAIQIMKKYYGENLYSKKENRFNFFICYIECRIAILEGKNKKIDRVSEYEDMLNCDEAKPLFDYFNFTDIVNDCDISLNWPIISELILLCNGSAPLSDEDLLDSLDLWPGNNKEVLQYIDDIRPFEGEKNKIFILLFILCVYLQMNLIVDEKTLVKEYISNKTFPKMVYSKFKKGIYYSKYIRIIGMNEKTFSGTLIRMYGEKFKASPQNYNSNITSIVDKVRENRYSDEILFQCFYIARYVKLHNITLTNNMYESLKSIFKVEDSNTSQSLGEDFYSNEEILNKAISEYRKVDPYRYIQYVKYRKQYGNLEADYVIMKKALENGSSRSLSLVVDAPPNIVEGIEKDIDHFGEMIYGFSSKELEQIYSQMKLNGKTALICPGGNPIQIKMQSKITSDGKIECKYGLYSYNNEEKIRQIVFYVDDDNKDLLVSFLEGIGNYIDQNSTKITLVMQERILNEKFRINILKRYDFDHILVMPSDIYTGNNKKHIVVSLMPHNTENRLARINRLYFYPMYAYTEQKRRQENALSTIEGYVVKDAWEMSVSQENFSRHILQCNKSVTSLYSEGRPRQEKVYKRKQSIRINFTPEIQVWYSWNNGRGRMSYYGVSTLEQLKRNCSGHGRKAKIIVPITAKSYEDGVNRISKKLLDDIRLNQVIISEMENEYKNNTELSLKSFWYCNRNEFLKCEDYDDMVAQSLMEIKYIGEIKSDALIRSESIVQEIEKATPGITKEKEMKLLKQVEFMVRKGIENERFQYQDVITYVNSLKRKRTRLQKVRSALIKKSYSLKEEKDMLCYIKAHMATDITYLGAAISFYTGMANCEIAALDWEDIHALEGSKSHHCFYVYKIKTQTGVELIEPDKKEHYRRIPIVNELEMLLDSQKPTDLKLKKDNTKKDNTSEKKKIEGTKIFSKMVKGESVRCTPDDIKRAKNNTEKSINIEPLIAEGNENGKGISTDLNQYNGDRFRTNIRYRMLQTCAMTVAEVEYILGLKQDSTYARHYCDFTNNFVQISLQHKLERWAQTHSAESSQGIMNVEIKNPVRTEIKGNNGSRVNTEIDCTVVRNDINDNKTELTLQNTRGMNVFICRMEHK